MADRRLNLDLVIADPDFRKPGWKHLLINVRDRTGQHSRYVDLQFEVPPEGRPASA